MKEEKTKYCLVQSTDLLKKTYELKRKTNFNQSLNVALSREYIEAKEVFDYFNVPEEYQKIIIKISNELLGKRVEEYITKYNFDKYNIPDTNKKKRIEASRTYEREQNLGQMGWQPLYDRIIFSTEPNYKDLFQVLQFLKKVEEAGYLKQYIDSINNIFMNKVHYDEKIFNTADEQINKVKRKLVKVIDKK